MQDEKEYEERADYIHEDDLQEWNVDTDFFREIQKKLRGRGAKLLVGPRGCGKTHQMRLARHSCLTRKNSPLPVYVSFTRYYRLEPLLHTNPAARRVFHTWVLAKILLECVNVAKILGLSEPALLISSDELSRFVAEAEKGAPDLQLRPAVASLTNVNTIECISKLQVAAGRKRVILLFDDAALSLTPDYMEEVFEVFRSLKTETIAPKASVYPGTTQYGPRFHVGQDAQFVQAWLDTESKQYEQFMDDLLDHRLTSIRSSVKPEILGLMQYAAFGIPRAFIVLVRRFRDSKKKTEQAKFNAVIEEQSELIRSEYLSLQQKLPQYRSIIAAGFELFTRSVQLLHDENNTDRKPDRRQSIVGIERSTDVKVGRMMKLLIEAGLFFEYPPVKHGKSREYRRLMPHSLFLIKNRTFDKGRGFKPRDVLTKLRAEGRKHPVRRNFESILGEGSVAGLRLDIPPCQSCDAPRIHDDQRFCHICGAELVTRSAYEECMNIKFSDLPILRSWKTKIRDQTDIETVGDFMALPDQASELRKTKLIGKIRAEDFINQLRKFVDEFLER